jgi:hypothetical protein
MRSGLQFPAAAVRRSGIEEVEQAKKLCANEEEGSPLDVVFKLRRWSATIAPFPRDCHTIACRPPTHPHRGGAETRHLNGRDVL